MSIEVALDGRLGNPPQSRVSAAGKSWVSFSLAVGRGEELEWVSIAAFEELAAELPSDLAKGERIYCEGKLTVWRRNGPGGLKATLSVAATRIVVLDRIGRRRRPSRARAAPGRPGRQRPAQKFSADASAGSEDAEASREAAYG